MEYFALAISYLRHIWAAIDLKTLVLFFGATWAFYKLVQSGGLHPLLDLKVSGKLIRIAGQEYLLCSMEIKNVHLPKVLIDYAGLKLSLKGSADDALAPAKWKTWAIFPVFGANKKAWSGETIRDKILLIAPAHQNFFRLEFRIGRRYRWYQHAYRWLTGSSSWTAVAIVQREPEDKGGGK